MQFITGVILGIVLATVGFSGFAPMADKAVDTVKAIAIEQSHKAK